MASNKILDLSFNWGDSVIVKKIAPDFYNPGLKGSICGIRTIDLLQTANEFDQEIASELYLVEFSDGETIEIPKVFLEILKI